MGNFPWPVSIIKLLSEKSMDDLQTRVGIRKKNEELYLKASNDR